MLNNEKLKLFILDTGHGHNHFTPGSAEVTKVHGTA